MQNKMDYNQHQWPGQQEKQGGMHPTQAHLLGLHSNPQFEGLLYGHLPASSNPLVSGLIGDQPLPGPEYGSSNQIVYAIDGSRSSMPNASQGASGSFRRMYASGTMGSIDPNMSMGR
jgi:hypothetical protein